MNMIMDWGLQAVVIGSSTSSCSDCHRGNNIDFSPNNLDFLQEGDQYLSFSHQHHHHEMKKEYFGDELEQLYKPFYHVGGTNSLMSSSISLIPKEVKEEKREDHQPHEQQVVAAAAASTYVPKYKKRKNEQKRVVLQLKADDLSSDKWAWRKYGQKPIKGSPYPRSYYRCSSSKGCLARKQVEQSCTEPGNFIVTYTAEHNHSQPTRRNSLAGTTKTKFPNSKNSINNNNSPEKIVKEEKISSPNGSTSNLALSPEALMIDEFPEIEINQENNNIYYDEVGIRNMFEGSDENECVSIQDMFDGDFFAGLEDIHDGFSSSFGCNINNSIFPFSS